jgi:hypothetical protein
VSENFELFEDALPVLEELRAARAAARARLERHPRPDRVRRAPPLDVDAIVGSRCARLVKPHPTIFQSALHQLGVEPVDAVMVGDSLEEDVEGARALGMRAILIDRDNRHPEVDERLTDLYGLRRAIPGSAAGAGATSAAASTWLASGGRTSTFSRMRRGSSVIDIVNAPPVGVLYDMSIFRRRTRPRCRSTPRRDTS